ncbi:MAG TPA: hypothetical protein VMI75_38485 [Polyangiaceae bacterium]|nr:hypothetical protein [Polyangiaceae bacterium]
MRRAWRAPFVVLASFAGAAGIAASCTTFDGVTVPPAQDASVEATPDVLGGDDASEDTSSGETGDDGTAGPAGFLSIDDAARLCSLAFQCDPYLSSSALTAMAVPIDPVNYSLCMHWMAAPIPQDRVGLAVQQQALQCIAGAKTCAQAGSCLSLENVAPNDPRCGDASPDAGDYCGDEGGTVFRCSQRYLLHCGSAYYAPGSQCMVDVDGTHWCALGNNCSVQNSCIGTINDYCGNGSVLEFGINCAYNGYTCGMAVNDDSGITGCYTGDMDLQCSSPGTTCSGKTLQVCDGYNLSEFDCAALGDTCSTQGGSGAICVSSSDTCTPYDSSENKCTGNTISLCIGGKQVAFDCASLGMTCVPASGATSGHCG